jgi:hypothetical protein
MAGGYGAGDPPDPIPNSEVKTRCADGTAGATRWESTAPPAFFLDKRPLRASSLGAGVWRIRRFRWMLGSWRRAKRPPPRPSPHKLRGGGRWHGRVPSWREVLPLSRTGQALEGCRQVVYGRGGRGLGSRRGTAVRSRCRSREGCAPAGPRTRSGGAQAVSCSPAQGARRRWQRLYRCLRRAQPDPERSGGHAHTRSCRPPFRPRFGSDAK